MNEKAKELGNEPATGYSFQCNGLTKREYFAAMAMIGINSNVGANGRSVESIASLSVQYADALLESLSRQGS